MQKFKRNEDGLFDHIEYKFTENSLIDWRRMIKAEHLVPNRDKTRETDVSKLQDSELIILLGGIKELAQIRGFTSVTYDIKSPSPDYVIAVCKIAFVPNFETEGKEVVFSAIGDASVNNTKSFARFFLGPIAENRAFVRCVRNFLKINIVAQEELGNSKLESDTGNEKSLDPRSILASLMREKSVTFDQIKLRLKKENYEDSDSLSSLEDIPKIKIFELIERIRKIKY